MSIWSHSKAENPGRKNRCGTCLQKSDFTCVIQQQNIQSCMKSLGLGTSLPLTLCKQLQWGNMRISFYKLTVVLTAAIMWEYGCRKPSSEFYSSNSDLVSLILSYLHHSQSPLSRKPLSWLTSWLTKCNKKMVHKRKGIKSLKNMSCVHKMQYLFAKA